MEKTNKNREKRRRRSGIEQILAQLRQARQLENQLRDMLPEGELLGALRAELEGIRQAFTATATALQELQQLILEGRPPGGEKTFPQGRATTTTTPKPRVELVPADYQLPERWKEKLLQEWGAAHEAVIQREVDRLWKTVLQGAPVPSRALEILRERVSRALSPAPPPAPPGDETVISWPLPATEGGEDET